jgi:hypothetical protein
MQLALGNRHWSSAAPVFDVECLWLILLLVSLGRRVAAAMGKQDVDWMGKEEGEVNPIIEDKYASS